MNWVDPVTFSYSNLLMLAIYEMTKNLITIQLLDKKRI